MKVITDMTGVKHPFIFLEYGENIFYLALWKP